MHFRGCVRWCRRRWPRASASAMRSRERTFLSTGATDFCYTPPLDPSSSAQARSACEACYGHACYLESADCAGLGWGPDPAGQYVCGQAYFGFQSGCSGDDGRAWSICNSYTTYGYWGTDAPRGSDGWIGGTSRGFRATRRPVGSEERRARAPPAGRVLPGADTGAAIVRGQPLADPENPGGCGC